MYRRRFAIATLVALSLSFAGCTNGTPEPPAAVNRPEASSIATTATEEPPAAPAVALHVIDETQFAEILEKHRGEVVLVDFWATWCVECLELMPHTVELQKELGEKGLHVMLVSLDSPEDRRETIEELLAKNGVTFDSYVSKYGSDPKSGEAFQIEGGALPNIKLYDHKGQLHKVFSAGRMPPEPFDAEDVETAVRELVGSCLAGISRE